MQNKIEFFLFNILSYFVTLFPLRVSRKLASKLAFLFYHFIPLRKEVARKNLQFVFPKFDKKKLNEVLFKSYVNFFIVLIEIFYLRVIDTESLKSMVRIKQPELIHQCLKKNKGLMFLSAHFGNWEILAASAALTIGIPYSIIVKPLRNPLVDKYINDMRCKWGNEVVRLGISVKDIYRELLSKNIIALVADQRAGEGSMKLPLFGKETSVFVGPATLSVKTGAPILIGLAVRQKDNFYEVDLVEIKADDNLSESDKIEQITKSYLSVLEDTIKKHPEQWLWFHDRWKH
ncbi:MAG: lysophospholipid acyltransferase family protein [Bacteroidetes bacterium]|nr:lysophospholipid acyltransferase family protein [Bacteroidota bacterium]MBU2586222.1 lysophospholipid acyltransferase family protein [Bacteroidota bacterium]